MGFEHITLGHVRQGNVRKNWTTRKFSVKKGGKFVWIDILVWLV